MTHEPYVIMMGNSGTDRSEHADTCINLCLTVHLQQRVSRPKQIAQSIAEFAQSTVAGCSLPVPLLAALAGHR